MNRPSAADNFATIHAPVVELRAGASRGEASRLAISTLDAIPPEHLLAGYRDYRWVEPGRQSGCRSDSKSEWPGTARSIWKTIDRWRCCSTLCTAPSIMPVRQKISRTAAVESTIVEGGSR